MKGLFEKANKEYRNKNYDEAIAIYKKLCDVPEALEPYKANLYLAHKKTGNKNKASALLYSELAKDKNNNILKKLLENENKNYIEKLDSPILSIIVPVYNSSKYLKKCIESILSQKFKDFELIVVNDGSTDESLRIIKEFEKNDNRLHLINNEKPSGNPGKPRNQALLVAKGKYIGFVDSDDWIEENFYDQLVNKAIKEKADIVFSGGFVNHLPEKQELRIYKKTDFENPDSENYKYHESFMIWDKVFSAKLLKSQNIFLGETKAAVDVPFIFKAYYYAYKVSFCSDLIGYNYRRESSSSVTLNYRKSSDCHFEITAYQDIEDWLKNESVPRFYFENVKYKKVNSFIYTLSVIAPKMFDKFYEKAKNHFSEIDRKLVVKKTNVDGKKHVLKKYDAVLASNADGYKSIYREDIFKKKKTQTKKEITKKEKHTFYLPGEEKGIIFFPDWSKRNPYQKQLYSSIAKNFKIRVKGYNEKLFNLELLAENKDNYKAIHLHWLHVFMDFSRDDGADEFIANIKKAKELGYKIIYTAHNIISHDSKYVDREKQFRKRAVKLFDYVLVHGEYAKDRIIEEIETDREKVYVVPHGSYEGYYPNFIDKKAARDYFGIEDTDYVYLFFGNIKGYKGVDQLLNSYNKVKTKVKNTKLIIAGRVFEKETGDLIDEHVELDSSIIFKPGFIEEKEAQYYFNAADIVVLPYRNILTSGAALLSFSFYKPVIAPKSGLLPNLVSDETLGHLFSDYQEMEEIMIKVSSGIGSSRSAFEETNKLLRWTEITKSEPFVRIFKPYRSIEVKKETDKEYDYALMRILGNDLPFRHSESQTISNLEFTLKNESEFSGCKKIWVLNRIIDKEKKKRIICMLDAYKKEYIDIPFVPSEFAEVEFCFEDLPKDDYKITKEYEKLNDRSKVIVETAILKHKNNYIMNNNGARNTALEYGKKIAKWVFPWDGNCFLTDKAWSSITNSLKARDDLHYHIVPMDRVKSNDLLLDNRYRPAADDEPQIIFHVDSNMTFDENLMYGLKPKVDLLKKLGVPGVWDNWNNLYPWKKHDIQYTSETFNYSWCGWVARLFSGSVSQEANAHERAINREKGIVSFIKNNDKAVLYECFDKLDLVFYNQDILKKLRNNEIDPKEYGLDSTLKVLKSNADEYVNSPTYSVVNKTTLPPSNDPHDYWHPAPYAWPNPESPDGLPYIHKDGERVPGTRMYEAESIKYDRTSIQKLFDETTALAVAGYIYNNNKFTSKAYNQIRSWFINPETAMNPNLNYSQVVMGKNGNKGTPSGLIETKDFYFFLDAVRLVKLSEYWTAEDDRVMNAWCQEFIKWLSTSEQGIKELHAKNNHGNAYDLQIYALLSFVGDIDGMYEALIRSLSRIKSHVDPDGSQPHELKRTTTQHYTAFNLHLWLSLSTIIENSAGISLVTSKQVYNNQKQSALISAADWVLVNAKKQYWPYKQIDKFDRSRYDHIYHNLSKQLPLFREKFASFCKSFEHSKEIFFPHDGIAPYWKLAIT